MVCVVVWVSFLTGLEVSLPAVGLPANFIPLELSLPPADAVLEPMMPIRAAIERARVNMPNLPGFRLMDKK
jgi:hypothetical protein